MQNARQHRDNNYPPIGNMREGPYHGPPGPSTGGSRSLPAAGLPKPIPARRDDHTPPPPRYQNQQQQMPFNNPQQHSYNDQHQQRASRPRSPQVRMRPLSRSPQHFSANYYRSPPPPSPPPALMDFQGSSSSYRTQRSPSRGRGSSSYPQISSSRGRGRGAATYKPSAHERLGPKLSLTDRLGPRGRGIGRGGGRGRGRGYGLLPTPPSANVAHDKNDAEVDLSEDNNKRYQKNIHNHACRMQESLYIHRRGNYNID